jgi:hypothetical protein
LKLKKNLARVDTIMAKDEMAIAGFVDKLKKYMARGIATPPPPIPATLLSIIMREKTNVPNHSLGVGGQRGLWTHSFARWPTGITLEPTWSSAIGLQM